MRLPTERRGIGDATGRSVGHEFGWLEYRIAPGHTAEIVNIEVDPEHRHEGVGRALLAALVEWLRGHAPEVKRVWVMARAGNRIACEFYWGTGFRRAAMIRDFYPAAPGAPAGEGDAVVYVRDL